MVQADALAAKHSQVVRTVEVLHALGMFNAKLFLQSCVFLFLIATSGLFEIKVCLRQDRILLHNFVKDVDVKRQALCTFELLDKLAADWAADAVVVVKSLDAAGAQSVSAVHQDAWDTLADVVLETTELADVKASRAVVQVQDLSCRGLLRHHFQLLLNL